MIFLNVGSVCFVDSCSSPFEISHIFKSSLSSNVATARASKLRDAIDVVLIYLVSYISSQLRLRSYLEFN